ncbi:MAG: transketolase, transketolase [Candidatus Taylorbacteria bacterium]|nr:transketolase, transketolase [Candidatus Taylorbacteria bacterium]
MLNQNQKLNSKIFDKDVEQVPIRNGFGEGLVEAAEKDERIVALCADLTESTKMLDFKNKFPNRFVEIGVAEQNLASVASGMAAMGKIPAISSYAMFSPGRNWEQIRTTICYNNRKVIIAGSHAGVSVGPDGGTHQAVEDIAITRVIPNMTVISPCDAIEAKKATMAILKDDVKTPVYLRLAREKTPIITTSDTPFIVGKAQIFFESMKPQVAIIATGALVHKALVVSAELEKKNIGSIVVNLSTIKPLDVQTIVEVAQRAGAVVTVEEHQIAGGMGSAIAECLAQNYVVPMEFVGVKNLFGQSGTPEQLLEHYEMTEKFIEKAVMKVVSRK